jgi:hypothetical protein
LRLVAPDCARQEPDDEAERDGEDDDRDLALAEHAPDDGIVEQIAEGAHDQQRERDREPERQPEMGAVAQPEGDERAEHHQIALREIHALRRLVDQHEAERDEPVDAAVR